MHLEFFQYFQLLSLLLAVWYSKGLIRQNLGVFIPILLVVNLVEPIGVNYKHSELIRNYSIYNIFILAKTPLYLYLYSRMLLLRKNERAVFAGIVLLCIAFVLVNFFYWQGPRDFNTYSVILTEIINFVLSCLGLLRLYMVETDNIILFREPYFWVNAANMLFALVLLVLLGLQQYIIANHINLGDKSLYHAILPSANIILYSLYSYAFILCRQSTAN